MLAFYKQTKNTRFVCQIYSKYQGNCQKMHTKVKNSDNFFLDNSESRSKRKMKYSYGAEK